ncbi:MAG TPA: MFS transporter [Tepidisphaeraceae bacterium]|nr:MFS transporter [Tepidisphaeraceae bacterium]
MAIFFVRNSTVYSSHALICVHLRLSRISLAAPFTLHYSSRMSTLQTDPTAVLEKREAESLRELTPQQWKSGVAAWLGWFFDGLDMHLYTLLAAPFVAQLMVGFKDTDSAVKVRSAWIQAAFLLGWAVGGGFFGRLGDLLGRSRALALTILTYACFTGLSFFATSWWHLLIFRFVAALGIGGEWAIGSSLLSETWPKRWGPWLAAILQTGVNLGVVGAFTAHTVLIGHLGVPLRSVFLVGIVPALIVYWIRRHVPEPVEWSSARTTVGNQMPGIRDLFAPATRRITILTIIVCASSLTAWWAFMFWNPQHMRNLPDVKALPTQRQEQIVGTAAMLIIGVSIAGNFFSGLLAKMVGYRRAIALMFLGFLISMMGAYSVPRGHESLLRWLVWVGFFSGVFGLFTMYLPPLFPVLLRTTGAGFSYNIGRIAAAFGTVFFQLFSTVGDFRKALLYDGFLFVPAMLVALMLPELRYDKPRSSGEQ